MDDVLDGLEAIQTLFEDLTKRIGSIATAGSAPPETAVHSNDSQNLQRDVLQEIRAGFDKVRADLKAITRENSPTLDRNMKRIADGIAALQDDRSIHPGYVDQMRSELATLQSGIEHLLHRQTPSIDLSGVSQSIETGYTDMVNKLESWLVDRPAGGDPEGQDAGRPDCSRRLDSIGRRLEEVTKTVTSLSRGAPISAGNDDLERIEARLNSLSHSVDRLIEGSSSHISEDALANMVTLLSDKLDNMAAMSQAGGQIMDDAENVSARLDTIHNEIGMVAEGLKQFAAGRSDNPEMLASVAAIESNLAKLADRMEAAAASRGDNPNAFGQEALGALQDLVTKVDSLEIGNSGPDNERFQALEIQLKDIADQLATLDHSGSGLMPLAKRLDDIENQIAASRDMVIDIASEAAQKSASDDIPVVDPAAVSGILNELRSLREAQAAAVAPDSRNNEQIAQVIKKIDRISSFVEELEANPLPTEASASVNHDFHTQQQYNPGQAASRSPHIERAAPAQAYSTQSAVADKPLQQVQAPSMDLSNAQMVQNELPTDVVREYRGGYQQAAAGVVGDQSEPAAQEVEDVPLAPGSGMPDLEALVRRATNKKKRGEGGSKGEENLSELMAAARRAAQAASIEAETAKQDDERRLKRSRLASGDSSSSLGRKILLGLGTAMVLAVGGMMAAPKIPEWKNQLQTLMASLQEPEPASQSNNVQQGATVNGKLAMEASEPIDDAESTVRIVTENETAQSPAKAAAQADLQPNGVRQEDAGKQEETVKKEQAGQEKTGQDTPVRQVTAKEDAKQEDVKQDDTKQDGAKKDDAKKDDAGQEEAQAMPSAKESQRMPVAPNAGAMPPKAVGNEALRQAAARGEGDALFEVGRRYTDGEGVKSSLEEAVVWYRRAAEKGYGPAQYRLGNFYEKGHGVTQDPVEAAKWYRKAADRGNALAMHNLAVLNAMGVIDGREDMAAAIGWFEKAAELGVKDSQVNLGILYTKGMGVAENLENAYKWFAIAAKGGDTDAAKKRDTVAQAMVPEQLERARGAAELWKPKSIDPIANVPNVRKEWKPVKQGAAASDDMVRQVQQLLSRAGFDAGPADGVMGARTRQAIIDFQKSRELPTDGRVSPALLKVLAQVSI